MSGLNSGLAKYELNIPLNPKVTYTYQTLGWAGFVNVDGKSYSFLGSSAVAATNFSQATQKSANVGSVCCVGMWLLEWC